MFSNASNILSIRKTEKKYEKKKKISQSIYFAGLINRIITKKIFGLYTIGLLWTMVQKGGY